MFDLTSYSLDAINAEVDYRHRVDARDRDLDLASVPPRRRRVLRRRVVRHWKTR